MIQNSQENILRRILKESERYRAIAHLYDEYVGIEKFSFENWVPLLSHDKGSLSGPAHISGVEEQVCALIEKAIDIIITPSEAYILLCSILFHDIGKIVDENKIADKSNLDKYGIDSNGIKNDHAALSALIIGENYKSFGISDGGLADCIAAICVSHKLEYAEILESKGHLKDKFFDQYGRVRLRWLSALLMLGDELDNSYHRSAPEWIRPSETGGENVKGNFRATLRGCEVNFTGKLLVVHPQKEMVDQFSIESSPDNCNLLLRLWSDIINKRKKLAFCYESMRQMNIELLNVAVDINGHLLDTKIIKLNNVDYYAELTVIAKNFDDESNNIITENKVKLKNDDNSISGNIFRTYLINIKHVDEVIEQISSLKNISSFRKSFHISTEPCLRQMKLDRVLDGIVNLRFNSFGKSTFPWETLSTVAGIENIEETKIIFHRISMLSDLYNRDLEEEGSEKELISSLVKLAPPVQKDKCNIQLKFQELDGEWSLNPVQSCEVDRNGAKKSIGLLYKWMSKIVSENYGDIDDAGFFEKIRNIKIENTDLSYLLDEFNYCGIKFEKSSSVLYDNGPSPNVGINLVVTGPPGVGKSTLAMELMTKGNFADNKPKSICAYYSLEQPIETIKKIAEDLLESNGAVTEIVEFNPNIIPINPFEEKKPSYVSTYQEIFKLDKSKVIFLPRLSPRTYGNIVEEDKLFWFRFKQLALLIEANKYFQVIDTSDDNSFALSTIAVDTLNAFSHGLLARRRIHQLFSLITWGGILGIYIIESNPSVESKTFQSEVESLADIVIHLNWETKDYQYKYMEIIKSRCQRNVLGKHPFKIRRQKHVEENTENDPNRIVGSDTVEPLDFSSDRSQNFEIFPSIHTQVSRTEKEKSHDSQKGEGFFMFSANEGLNGLVHKMNCNNAKETGIYDGSFIVLRGKAGGHKLAIGMNYVHGNIKEESALVINMGQPIAYKNVASYNDWWKSLSNESIIEQMVKWNNDKVDITCYGNYNDLDKTNSHNKIYIMNFHSGFLLAEEFLKIVKTFIEGRNKEMPTQMIKRVLFNSTAHLPERFPLLDKNPLFFQALIRLLKNQGTSLMIIAVEGVGNSGKIRALSAMADLKITVHHFSDDRLPETYKKEIKDMDGSRIISSDNVTGKDYEKRYQKLTISPTPSIIILPIEKR